MCMATKNEDFENGSNVILRMCADMPYDMRKGLRETDVEKLGRKQSKEHYFFCYYISE